MTVHTYLAQEMADRGGVVYMRTTRGATEPAVTRPVLPPRG